MLPPPLRATPLVVVCRDVVCVFPPDLFFFASISVCVCGFSSLARPRRRFRFPVPVAPVISPTFGLMLVLSSLGSDVGTLPQKLAGNESASVVGGLVLKVT